LRERSGRARFPVQWQPAVIGRPDADHVHNELLAANLEWLPEGLRVSRRHAQITEEAGIFYLENLAGRDNPTYLNGRSLAGGRRVALQHGDAIRLGQHGVELRFELG
jgi:pSer/pThr/pTyr-binding forkhead associated (FHA) protein